MNGAEGRLHGLSARVLSWSAWTIAAASVLCVLAPSLKWASTADGPVDLYRVFGADGVSVFAPRLVGAMVAVPAAVAAAALTRSWRLGCWTVAALALLGQMTMSLEWLSAGHRLASHPEIGPLQVGWYVDLVVVALGSVAMAVGAYVVVMAVRTSGAALPRQRPGAAVASVALGVAVTWLLSRDLTYLGSWAWAREDFFPPLSIVVLAAAWTVVVVGAIGPVLSVALARRRDVAVGVVGGWWAFLAVPWTEAVVIRARIGPVNPTSGAFWVGTAFAAIGGIALIAWTTTAGPRDPRRPESRSAPGPEDWPTRTDEDPLRR